MKLTSKTMRCRKQTAILRWAQTAALTLLLTAGLAQANDPVDRFLNSLDADATIAADARNLIRTTWADCKDCDGAEFLTQGLAVVSTEFRGGLDAYDAEEYEQCTAIMGELRNTENLFVATHAAAYEIKALVALERLIDAGKRIETLLDGQELRSSNVPTYSFFAPEIAFLEGFCLLADLEYDRAERALMHFISDYPGASQRLFIAAQQMLAELQTREPEKIGEVCDLMTFAGRRLGHGDASDAVRIRQKRVIELLDKLIKDAEENESSNSSSSSGGGKSSGKKGAQQPSKPMQDSQLPGGGPAEGTLRERRRANPGDVWGTMPPAQRERILQALRDNFPNRYRQLVEQYYEELAKKP